MSIALGISVMNIGIAICIGRCVRYPSGGIGRILKRAPDCLRGVLI